jgi:hypothetical protein
MMLTVLPDWVRVIAVCLIWVIVPLQLWLIHWTYRRHKQWQEGESARMARWTRDMEAASKLHEEASHLRAQAEVALAQARRQQAFNDKQGS